MRNLIEQLGGILDEMSSKKAMKQLRRAGREVVRQKGSHAQVVCPPDGAKGTVPMHGSKDIPKGTLKAIEKDTGVDIDGDGRPKPRKKK